MPKAKVTRDSRPAPSTATGSSRTPVKINTGGTPLWYKIIMFGLMILGLAWLIVFYIAGSQIHLRSQLDPWDCLIGFTGLILGLLMTMDWR